MELTGIDVLGHLPSALREAVRQIAQKVHQAGGCAYLVGGCVRDALLDLPTKDADVEVFGLSAEEVRRVLAGSFNFVEVGASFGVFKLRNLDIDVSIPRRERKEGSGHRGFAITGAPHLSLSEAAARRDFTVNALYWDVLQNRLEDPHGGLDDLQQRCLRHTSGQFSEDPLRVLRAMQQIARFDLAMAPETLDLCRRIEPEDLAPERIFEEFRKLILKGRTISRGLEFLKSCGWIRYFPELQALVDCPQEPQWHPEGDVWTHTAHCMDAFARERLGEDGEDLIVGFAVLCHDFGKPATTIIEDGRIKSPAHDVAGEQPTRDFLGRLTRENALHEAVVPLVLTHMIPAQLYQHKSGDGSIRRLAKRVGRIDRLVRVMRADMQGRPPLTADMSAGEWLLEQAARLAVQDSAPQPILLGRHLIQDFGMSPGRAFRPCLDAAYEAQLDGVFDDLEAAREWFKKFLLTQKENDRSLPTSSSGK